MWIEPITISDNDDESLYGDDHLEGETSQQDNPDEETV